MLRRSKYHINGRFNLAKRGIYARRLLYEAEPAAYRGGGGYLSEVIIQHSNRIAPYLHAAADFLPI